MDVGFSVNNKIIQYPNIYDYRIDLWEVLSTCMLIYNKSQNPVMPILWLVLKWSQDECLFKS